MCRSVHSELTSPPCNSTSDITSLGLIVSPSEPLSETTVQKKTEKPGKRLPFWPLWVPVAAYLSAFGASILMSLGIYFTIVIFYELVEDFMSSSLADLAEKVLETFIESAVQIGALTFVFLIGSKLRGGISAARVGLNKPRIKPAVGWSILVLVLSYGAELLANLIAPHGAHQDPLLGKLDIFAINRYSTDCNSCTDSRRGNLPRGTISGTSPSARSIYGFPREWSHVRHNALG